MWRRWPRSAEPPAHRTTPTTAPDRAGAVVGVAGPAPRAGGPCSAGRRTREGHGSGAPRHREPSYSPGPLPRTAVTRRATGPRRTSGHPAPGTRTRTHAPGPARTTSARSSTGTPATPRRPRPRPRTGTHREHAGPPASVTAESRHAESHRPAADERAPAHGHTHPGPRGPHPPAARPAHRLRPADHGHAPGPAPHREHAEPPTQSPQRAVARRAGRVGGTGRVRDGTGHRRPARAHGRGRVRGVSARPPHPPAPLSPVSRPRPSAAGRCRRTSRRTAPSRSPAAGAFRWR